jgi:hypothetical protein
VEADVLLKLPKSVGGLSAAHALKGELVLEALGLFSGGVDCVRGSLAGLEDRAVEAARASHLFLAGGAVGGDDRDGGQGFAGGCGVLGHDISASTMGDAGDVVFEPMFQIQQESVGPMHATASTVVTIADVKRG